MSQGLVVLPTVGTVSGLTMTQDTNTALAALATFMSGASAPTTGGTGLSGLAGIVWHDTSANLLKIRNQADSAWIVWGTFDETNGVLTPGNGILFGGGTNTPGGRLTLTSNTPVMTADASSQSTIYYAPYVNNQLMVYNGAYFATQTFSQLSLILDASSGHTGYQAGNNLFDVFAFLNSGVLTLGTGPLWSGTTTRAAAITLLNGLWVNNASITLRFGNASGNTATVAANQATYLGTLYTVGNGQTSMQFTPAGSPGGSNTILGLYNGYNRVRTVSRSLDSAASWTYTTSTWRAANNNSSNRITFVDGLQQSFIEAKYSCLILSSSTSVAGSIGVNLDATTGSPAFTATGTSASTAFGTTSVANDLFKPQLGLHYLQAMELAGGATNTFFANNGDQMLTACLEM